MRISAEFIRSAVREDQFPKERLPEIAMAGRSNVGKSSLINTLLGKKGLAHTSNTPGRTQALNYYRVAPEGKATNNFYLVDMPGYGYASVSAGKRAQWARLIEDYLSARDTLVGIIHLLDLRHPPQPLDLQMAEWLRHSGRPFLVVGTKADKVAKTKVDDHLKVITDTLGIPEEHALAFSAETGLGRDALWRIVLEMIKAR